MAPIRGRFRWPAVVLLALGIPTEAAPQLAFGADTLHARPLALSISGGISLGSYQAGVNHALLELYRRAIIEPGFGERSRIPAYRVRSITGASAGNVNTLLWAVEACTQVSLDADGRYRSPAPDQSLFWQVWGDMGWERLFAPHAPEHGIFDRDALIDSVARKRIVPRLSDPALVEHCAIPAGITLTRILPDTIFYQDLPIETQRHATVFTLIVERDGSGEKHVRFAQEARVHPGDPTFGSLVRIAADTIDIPLGTLFDAVKASAAFPFAFAPVELSVHYPRHGPDTRAPRWFSDGGVFDNNPVGLARELYHATAGADAADTLDILYVNPGRLRGEFATARSRVARATSPGGIAAVLQLIPGAIVTARQYELQLLARERQQREREDSLLTVVSALKSKLAELDTVSGPEKRESADARRDTRPRERLLLSSRAYPLFSEHLGAFAGFLGRPAREFDMHVGIYDGYYLAAYQHSCARGADGRVPTDSARHACVGATLPNWIADEHFLPDPGRQVLAWLYDHEFRTDSTLSRAVAGAIPATGSLRDQVHVQRVIFNALGTQYAARSRDAECTEPQLVHQILCADGLLEVLETIAADAEASRIIREWSECEEGTVCRVEGVFSDLVRNWKRGATRIVDDVMQRMRVVEASMKRDSTRMDDDYVRLVTGLQWVYNSSHLRSRPTVDFFPNSIPTTSIAQYSILSYVGANLGSGGIDARWEPVWNFWRRTFAHAAVGYHYTQSPIASAEHHYSVFGGGVGRYSDRVWLSQFGVALHRFRPLTRPDTITRSFTEIEPFIVILAGQIRISSRSTLGRRNWGLVHGPHGWTMSVGMADPVGLIYWIAKMR